MQQDLYEYLFNLRASGFTHNSSENIRQMFLQGGTALAPSSSYAVNSDGEVSNQNVTGEFGSFSSCKIQHLRYTFVVIATSTSVLTPEHMLSRERAASLSDYYINRVDEICSAEDFLQLVREMGESFQHEEEKNARPAYGQPIDTCIEFIEQNLYSNLTVNRVAEHLGYTPTYLSTLFKRVTGQPLYSYIQAQRLSEARTMLCYTRQPITLISSALGFHSISHFSKAFKAAEGITPSAFRKQISHGKPSNL